LIPLVKWPGGKRNQIEAIWGAFGESCPGTFREPFAGSGAVVLGLRARGIVDRAEISDINPRLIAFHLAIRDRADDVIEALDALPRVVTQSNYYEIRDLFNDSPQVGPEHAARFLWLNRAGFNGLYRENKAGKLNVAIGYEGEIRHLPGPHQIRAVSGMLEGVIIRCEPFAASLSRVVPGDWVYCDPPYVPASPSMAFVGYSAGGFGYDAQEALGRACEDAAASGAVVVVSNRDQPLTRDHLYPTDRGWEHVQSLDVRHSIGRKRAAEMIARIVTIKKDRFSG
jgi:DNA adenine methylase